MAIKAFLTGINVNAGYLAEGGPLVAFATANSPVVIFENGTPVAEPGQPNTGITLGGLPVLFVSTDTLATLRPKMQAAIWAEFNAKLGRADGNTMTFVWLDDKGLL